MRTVPIGAGRIALTLFLLFPQLGCSTTGQQGAVLCGLAGALIGSAVSGRNHRGDNALLGAGVGAVACGVVGEIVDQRRREALAREQALDRRIAAGRESVAGMEEQNQRLAYELSSFQQQAENLRNRRDQDSQEAAALRSSIEGERQGARASIGVVDRRVRNLDAVIADNSTPYDARQQAVGMRQNLLERRAILERIQTIEV